MELRSAITRSRSNTPFSPIPDVKDVIVTGNHIEKVTRTRNTTTIKTYENDSKHMKLKSKKSQRGVAHKTSDYSSEEGEHESSAVSRHISDNLKNQMREESLYSSNGNYDMTALKVYKEAGEYWNKYPKTDYTYSKHSKDRIELAPGVVAMPNMSRRSLHQYNSSDSIGYTLNKQTSTDSFLEGDLTDYGEIKSNGGYGVKQRLFSSNNNHEEEDEDYIVLKRRTYTKQTSTIFQKFVRTLVAIITTIFYPLYYIYRKQHSFLLWFGKKLHKVSSRMMLLDTWLLRGSTSDRKMSTVLALCFLPLILFGGWWLLCGLGQLIQTAIGNSTAIPAPVPVPPEIFIRTPLAPTESALIEEKHFNKRDQDDGAIDELRSKIDIILRKLAQSNNQQIDLSIFDNSIQALKMKIESIQKELAQTERNRKDDLTNLLAELEQNRKRDKEEIFIEMREQYKKSFIDVEHYIFLFLKEIFNSPDYVVNKEDFSKWIRLIFVTHSDLESRLIEIGNNLRGEFPTLFADNEKLLMDKITEKILEMNVQLSKDGGVAQIEFTDEHIKKLVQDALAVYDADKTGLVDFAMESSGGQVISTRCTESYQARTATISIFGFPIYYPTKSPRTAITPGTSPGECWAFQNFPGFLVVQLSAKIFVKGFTLEHISKRLSTAGKIDSALKKFEVYGLLNENDPDPVLLGSYEYKESGTPLQYFPVTEKGNHVFDMVELRILSNHGNPNYTCLYRFRVHGTLSLEPT